MSEVEPGTHRLPGRARVATPTPTFGAVLRENPREPALVGLLAVTSVGWGVTTLASGPAVGAAAASVLAIVAGPLILVSYVLRFVPEVLPVTTWPSTPLRRTARVLLSYAWAVALTEAIVVGLTDV